MTPPEPDEACPVCGLPTPPEPAEGESATGDISSWCARCSWQLAGPPILSSPTRAVTEEFEERLSTAQRRFDLLAVARVEAAIAAADPGRVTRMADAVRNAPAKPGELEDARAALAGAPPDVAGEAPTLTSVLMAAIGRHAADARLGHLIAVAEVSADAVVLLALEPGRLGLPVVREAACWGWEALLPGLPDDPRLRLLRLAGGFGVPWPGRTPAEWSTGRAEVADAVATVVAAAEAAGASELIVASRLPAAWDLPARFTSQLAANGTLPATPARAGPEDCVDAALKRAPTAWPYALVVADVDEHSRTVALGTVPLFDAGLAATPGTRTTAEVAVTEPRDGGKELFLCVVATPPWPDSAPAGNPSGWCPVDVARYPLDPASPVTRVRVCLESARRVSFIEPGTCPSMRTSGGYDDTAVLDSEWAELLACLPPTYGTPPTDLVLMIELGAPAEYDDQGARRPRRAEARLRLARELLSLLASKHPDPDTVQVTVLGYADHRPYDPGPVLRVIDACAPAAALPALAAWAPSPVYSESRVAPAEDALHAAAVQPWRPSARGVLITFGARPPHLASQGTRPATPCPRHHDWERSMRDLVTRVVPTRIAVREPAPFGRVPRDPDAGHAWRELGADAELPLASTTARVLADRAHLLPADTGDAVPGLDVVPEAGPRLATNLVVPLRARLTEEGVHQ